ncbi:Protein kinase-like domain containing protein [Elaphomyces granulatus]
MESAHIPPLPSLFMHTNPSPTLIAQGAEAHLYKTSFLTPSIPAALKIRPSKPYRHPILDRRLSRQRILHEARCLVKLMREGVLVPGVLALDWEGSNNNNNENDAGNQQTGGAWLLMEWIEGPSVRLVLEKWEVWMKRRLQLLQPLESGSPKRTEPLKCVEEQEEEERIRDLMGKIGYAVGSMHKAGVIHGDLTTSNIILRKNAIKDRENNDSERLDDITIADPVTAVGDEESQAMDGEIVLIDFGLAGQSTQEEDRAVDLYVLERAFGSAHPRTEGYFGALLQAYRESFKGAPNVLRKLEEVRMRGRKRSMVG